MEFDFNPQIIGTDDGLKIGVNIDNIPLDLNDLGIDEETLDAIQNAMKKGKLTCVETGDDVLLVAQIGAGMTIKEIIEYEASLAP